MEEIPILEQQSKKLVNEIVKRKGFKFDFYKMNLQPNGSEYYAANPDSYVIGSDGMIYKCTVAFNNPYNHVGWLKENGEMEIYEDHLSLWLSGRAMQIKFKFKGKQAYFQIQFITRRINSLFVNLLY